MIEPAIIKEKKKYYVDASLLKEGGCFRKLINKAILNISSRNEENYKMAFGSAGHHFLDPYYRGLPLRDCVERAVEYYKPYLPQVPATPYEFRTLNHLIETCKKYIKSYPRNKDGIELKYNSNNEPLIENTFSTPVISDENNELILCGTIDIYGKYHSIDNTFIDHKFIGMPHKEGIFEHYRFDIQTLMYSLMTQKMFKLEAPPSFIINGIFIKKPTIKASQAGEFDGCEFHRSTVFQMPQKVIDNFEQWLSEKLDKIWNTIITNPVEVAEKDYNPALCMGKFGKMCEYFDLCAFPSDLRESIIKMKYKDNHYQPLKFREL